MLEFLATAARTRSFSPASSTRSPFLRSIDLKQGDRIDEAGLKELVRAAVAKNSSKR